MKAAEVLAPARLVVRGVVSEWLHVVLIEPLGLPACLRMVGCGEKNFGAQYSTYEIKEPDDEMLSVIC